MRRWTVCAVVLVAVVLCMTAEADEVRAKKSRLLEVSGSLSLDWLWQDSDVSELLYGVGGNAAFCDPTLSLDMLFSLKDGLRAFVQLRTPYYLDDDIGSRPLEVSVTGGTAYYPSRVFQISQLYLKAEEFKWSWLDLCIGVQHIRYQITRHGAFLLALGESEDPFAGTVYGNWPTDRATPSEPAVYSNRFSFNERAAGSVEAGGILFTMRPRMPKGTVDVEVDFLAMTTYETRHIGQDRDVVGLVGRIFYPKKSDPQVDAMLALLTFGANSNSRIITIGGGFNWKATRCLEVYMEAYGQIGEFYEDFKRPLPGDDYYWLSSQNKTIEQQAFAGYGGIRYTYIPSSKEKGYAGWRPFFDISYWWISGDKNPHDTKNQDFIAYEDIDSTLVMEEDRYGLDLDTNYWALKLSAGYNPHKNVEFSVLYALFQRARDYTAKDKIGNEVDIVIKWHYTVALTFRFGIGVVWDSSYLLGDDKSSLSAGLFEVVLKF